MPMQPDENIVRLADLVPKDTLKECISAWMHMNFRRMRGVEFYTQHDEIFQCQMEALIEPFDETLIDEYNYKKIIRRNLPTIHALCLIGDNYVQGALNLVADKFGFDVAAIWASQENSEGQIANEWLIEEGLNPVSFDWARDVEYKAQESELKTKSKVRLKKKKKKTHIQSHLRVDRLSIVPFSF